MGKVNVCLKYVFLFFNALFNVFGWLGIIGAVNSASAGMSGGIPILTWVVIIGIICISGLGMHGGRKENALTLKIFAGCMGIGMVIMLICGIIVIVQREQFQDTIHNGSIHVTKQQAELVDEYFQIGIGVLFGLFVAAVLSLGMSSMMIHQIERHDSGGTASFSM